MSSQNISKEYSRDVFKIPILEGTMLIVVEFPNSVDDIAIERLLDLKKQEILDVFQKEVQEMLNLSPEEDVTRAHLLKIHPSSDIQWEQSIVFRDFLYENNNYTVILVGWFDTYSRCAEM